jgi:hypothetical protein
MIAPNLFLIGTQKGGSSSFFDHLVSHPDIASVGRKEPNIFATASEEEARARLAGFAPLPATRWVIDASVDYSRFPKVAGVPRTIAAVAGRDVRFVYILRHPVERLISEFFYKKAKYGGATTLARAIEADPQMVDTGRYDIQIEQYLALFDRGQFLIMLTEQMHGDTQAQAGRVFDWLGLPPHHWTGAEKLRGATKKTTTRDFRFGAATDLLWRQAWLRTAVRRVLPERTVRRVMGMLTVETARVMPDRAEKRALLDRHFRDSIGHTAALTGLDLGAWLTAYD